MQRLLVQFRAGVAIAFLACAVALVGIGQGYYCGAMSSGSSCTQAGCTQFTQQCVSFVHPFLPPLLAVALLGAAALWRKIPIATIALGVVAAVPATLAGLSLGFWGVAIAWLLVIAGLFAMQPPRNWAWPGLAAAVLPFPLFMAAALLGLPVRAAIALMAAPAIVWLGGVAAARLRQRTLPPPSA
jgi:hypothetical protein